MAIPFVYNIRNVMNRPMSTLTTALGIGLTVAIFIGALALAAGFRASLVSTGRADNAIVLRKGAGAEINSAVARDQAGIIETLPGIASDTLGRTMVSREPVVLINLPKRGNGKPSNVTVRGTSEMGGELRPQVRISEGRMFRPGTSEIVAGSAVAAGFQGVGLGQTLRFAGRDWLVVGIVDAGRSGFDSELWGDGEQMLQAFRRNAFSTVVLRLADVDGFERIRKALEDDPRLSLEAKPERVFYAEQSEALATFIRLLGTALAVIFSIGAVVGAMITMFAAVAARTAEIGTLRALGFRRRAVLLAFLGESLLLATLGGVLGLAGASAMQAVDISTTNFQTFAELAFRFVLTPSIALQSMAFALAMGIVGGFVPAWRAARLEIAECLRAA